MAIPGLGLALLLTASSAAWTQTPADTVAADLRGQIEACFSPPAEAEGRVRFALELARDGTLTAGPEIVSQEGSPAFAASARRAILRCAPYHTGAAGRIEVRFTSGTAPDAITTSTDATPAFSGEPLPGARVPFRAPEGLCFVDPTRSRYEAQVWTVFQPPRDRQEILETLAMDCATLTRSLDGSEPKPVEVAIVARTEDPSRQGETLEQSLRRITAKISVGGSAEPRFWESPPVAGHPYLRTDEQAAYSVARYLSSDGGISTTALYGYTRVGGDTRTFLLSRLDGSNIHPDSIDRVVKWIRAARGEAGERRLEPATNGR